MIRCSICGKEIPEDSVFCPFCGNPISAAEKQTIAVEEAAESSASQSTIRNGSSVSKKEKQPKRVLAFLVIFALLAVAFLIIKFVFPGLFHNHTWADATCTEPKTCTVCKAKEGDPLGHDWADATCTSPKTCKRCGETEGSALGHINGEWQTVTAPTLSDEGKEERKCTVCGQIVDTRAIPTKEIKYSSGAFNFSKEEILQFLQSNFSSNTGVQEEGYIDTFGDCYSVWDIKENSMWGIIAFPENRNGNVTSVKVFGEARSFFLMGAVLEIMTGQDVDDQTMLNQIEKNDSYSLGNLKVTAQIEDTIGIFTIKGK